MSSGERESIGAPLVVQAISRWTDDDLYPDLDDGIRTHVRVLREADVETFESCEGWKDHPGSHAYPEPTVRFHGSGAAGWKAYAALVEHDLPVKALRRTWPNRDGVPTGPYWEVVFYACGPQLGGLR